MKYEFMNGSYLPKNMLGSSKLSQIIFMLRTRCPRNNLALTNTFSTSDIQGFYFGGYTYILHSLKLMLVILVCFLCFQFDIYCGNIILMILHIRVLLFT